jgi:hypothetical protein
VVLGVCLACLGAEAYWRQAGLNRLAAELERESAQAAADHQATVTARKLQAETREKQLESEYQSRLTNQALLSGALARDRHAEEWNLRLAHDPRLASTLLETNLLTMEQWGRDASLAAQAAIQKVAELSAPAGSRVAVTPDGDGFIVRVAFLMSRLSQNEAGAVTKYQTPEAMRHEIQGLSAQVLRNLYAYCGARGIKSISVTCNHTLRQAVVPPGATPEERRMLIEQGTPVPSRLFRVSLDQAHAREIVDWLRVPIPTVVAISTVEYDGLNMLTLIPNSARFGDAQDAAGELQF